MYKNFILNPNKIGWKDELNREDTEKLLVGTPDKTFLTRYSPQVKSFIVSYSQGLFFNHIANIKIFEKKNFG